MSAHTHESGALSYILVQPDGYDGAKKYPLIVLLHGFGANMHDLVSLSPAIDGRGYFYAFPNAPYPVDFGSGAVGYSWSLNRPGVSPADSVTEPNRSAEERLELFLNELVDTAGAEPGNIVLGGFSQGGGLTLRFGLPRPQTFAGLAVLSGAFREEEGLRTALPAARNQPVFIGQGRYDPMVTLERGQATREFLAAAGYAPEYHEYDMAHEISDSEIEDLRAWLARVLPSAAARD
jgi:phospholipase/carboxylesterase